MQGVAQQREAGRSQDQIDAEQQDRRRPEPAGQPAQDPPEAPAETSKPGSTRRYSVDIASPPSTVMFCPVTKPA